MDTNRNILPSADNAASWVPTKEWLDLLAADHPRLAEAARTVGVDISLNGRFLGHFESDD